MAKRVFSAALLGCAALALAACNASKNGSASGSGSLDEAEKASETLLKTGGTGDDWAGIGYSYDEQRFSPLTDINDRNVGELGIAWYADLEDARGQERSEEHTSELQSLMRTSYAVFCLTKKNEI